VPNAEAFCVPSEPAFKVDNGKIQRVRRHRGSAKPLANAARAKIRKIL